MYEYVDGANAVYVFIYFCGLVGFKYGGGGGVETPPPPPPPRHCVLRGGKMELVFRFVITTRLFFFSSFFWFFFSFLFFSFPFSFFCYLEFPFFGRAFALGRLVLGGELEGPKN